MVPNGLQTSQTNAYSLSCRRCALQVIQATDGNGLSITLHCSHHANNANSQVFIICDDDITPKEVSLVTTRIT